MPRKNEDSSTKHDDQPTEQVRSPFRQHQLTSPRHVKAHFNSHPKREEQPTTSQTKAQSQRRASQPTARKELRITFPENSKSSDKLNSVVVNNVPKVLQTPSPMTPPPNYNSIKQRNCSRKSRTITDPMLRKLVSERCNEYLPVHDDCPNDLYTFFNNNKQKISELFKPFESEYWINLHEFFLHMRNKVPERTVAFDSDFTPKTVHKLTERLKNFQQRIRTLAIDSLMTELQHPQIETSFIETVQTFFDLFLSVELAIIQYAENIRDQVTQMIIDFSKLCEKPKPEISEEKDKEHYLTLSIREFIKQEKYHDALAIVTSSSITEWFILNNNPEEFVIPEQDSQGILLLHSICRLLQHKINMHTVASQKDMQKFLIWIKKILDPEQISIHRERVFTHDDQSFSLEKLLMLVINLLGHLLIQYAHVPEFTRKVSFLKVYCTGLISYLSDEGSFY